MIRRKFRAVFSIALVFAGADFARAASDWQIVKIGNRDYLSLDNVAKFYGLPTGVEPVAKKVRLDNGRNEIEVMLESREAIINGVRNWFSFPVVEKDGKYLLSRVDLSKTIEPQFRPQMIPNLGKVQTVVLDPGHGGHDKGAVSTYGFEKDYALDVARQIKPLLEARGMKVIMTRDSDVFIPLEERARIANATRDSVFVSIHFNATDYNASATGFEIYSLTPRGSPSTQDDALALYFSNMQAGSPVDAQSIALSTSIYHSVLGHIPEFDRGIKRARFAVLRLTRIPAILMEGGFLTERGESRLIANSAWRAKYAQSIAVGIENYKLLADKHRRPNLLAEYRAQAEGELVARDATKPPPAEPATLSAVSPVSNAALQNTRPADRNDAAPNEFDESSNKPAPSVAPTPEEVAQSSPPAPELSPVASPSAAETVTELAQPPETLPGLTSSPAPDPIATTSSSPVLAPKKYHWWDFGPFRFQQ